MIHISLLSSIHSLLAARTLLAPDTYLYIGWGILALLTLAGLLVWWRARRRWKKWTVGVVVPLLWCAFVYGAFVGPYELEVRRVELGFDDLPPAFDGYRIVLFSDLHVGTLTDGRRTILERAIDSINAQQADLAVFAGDLQNKKPMEIAPFVDLLNTVEAKDGVFAVKGNHDYPMYVDDEDEKYEDELIRSQIDETIRWSFLNNGRTTIVRGDEHIIIAGMENDGDGERFPQKGNIQQTLSRVFRDEFVVMLEHDPSAWRRKILPQSHVQLTLSGHTHGGQVSLFGLSPALFAYSEPNGLYTLGGRSIYVTSGVGGVVPFRLGVSPEIVVITLRKSSQKP